MLEDLEEATFLDGSKAVIHEDFIFGKLCLQFSIDPVRAAYVAATIHELLTGGEPPSRAHSWCMCACADVLLVVLVDCYEVVARMAFVVGFHICQRQTSTRWELVEFNVSRRRGGK